MHELLWSLRERVTGLSHKQRGVIGLVPRSMAATLYRRVSAVLGFYIPIRVRFSGKPYFPHGLAGIFISEHVSVGARAVILQQVTIGSNSLIDSKGIGAPTVGDDCYIGAGAKVIGGITIGDGVRIGANAVVTRDVPSHSTVFGTNQIISGGKPKDNTHFRRTKSGWQAVTGDGERSCTYDEEVLLEKAFPNMEREA